VKKDEFSNALVSGFNISNCIISFVPNYVAELHNITPSQNFGPHFLGIPHFKGTPSVLFKIHGFPKVPFALAVVNSKSNVFFPSTSQI